MISWIRCKDAVNETSGFTGAYGGMMTTQRAEGVAEVLWELKRADKLGTYSAIATRAGFSAGSNGRAMRTTMVAVRKHWPHLQWWRAVTDDGILEKDSDQIGHLEGAGYEFEAHDDDGVQLKELEAALMSWEESGADGDMVS